MIHLSTKRIGFSFLIATALTLNLAVACFAQESGQGSGAPAAAKTMPPGWNGNLCDADSTRVCLGVQGHSRDAWVHCMREHYDQLTPDCQTVMAPSNFKTPLRPEMSPTAKAAPSLLNP
jgi:hypothetical protein